MADLARGLGYLRSRDAALARVIDASGPIPLRRHRGGFEGLARIIVAQQVSKASADAIHGRLAACFPELSAANYLAASDQQLKGVGLSGAKRRCLTEAAIACESGALDFAALSVGNPDDAIAQLVRIRGIGRWTAEVYLMFCAGHADIFPSGDLALRIAAHEALGMAERPDPADLARRAAQWSPWRAVAARVLWAWYGSQRGRAIMP